MDLFRRLRRSTAPVIDVETMARDIAERTGIDLPTVHAVLAAEHDYLVRAGIAEPDH
jgi:hypothetical protein